jgi:hypothetical protein
MNFIYDNAYIYTCAMFVYGRRCVDVRRGYPCLRLRVRQSGCCWRARISSLSDTFVVRYDRTLRAHVSARGKDRMNTRSWVLLQLLTHTAYLPPVKTNNEPKMQQFKKCVHNLTVMVRSVCHSFWISLLTTSHVVVYTQAKYRKQRGFKEKPS